MQKFAEAPVEFASRSKPNFDPADLNSEGVGGVLADALGLGTVGSQRAGRAVALQDAMGREPDFRLKYPTLSALPAAVLGGVSGQAIGNWLFGKGNSIEDLDPNKFGGGSPRYGGYQIGSLAGVVLDGLIRNRQIKRVNEEFRNHTGPITPVARKGNMLGIFAGGHGQGRAEGLEALVTGKPNAKPQAASMSASVLGNALGMVNPKLALAAYPLQWGVLGTQVYHKAKARGKIQNMINAEFGYAPSGAVPLFAKQNGPRKDHSLQEFQMMLAAAEAAGKKPTPELFQQMREENDRQKSASAQDAAMAHQYVSSGRAPSPWHRQNMPGMWQAYEQLRNQRDAQMHTDNARLIATDAAAYGLKPAVGNPWEAPSTDYATNLARMGQSRAPAPQIPPTPRPAVNASQMAANNYGRTRGAQPVLQRADNTQLVEARRQFEAFKARHAPRPVPATRVAQANAGGWQSQASAPSVGWEHASPKAPTSVVKPMAPVTPNKPLQAQAPQQPTHAGVRGIRGWHDSPGASGSLLGQTATNSTFGGPTKSAKAGGKASKDVITAKRTSPPVHSWMDKVVFGQEEMAAPTPQDIAKWEKIVRHMKASAPTELENTKVFSGPVASSHFIKQIEKGKHNDTALEYVGGDRDMLAQAYAATPPEYFGQFGASYHPHADSVVLNERSPGALIHEMGHAADLQRRDGESNLSRWLRWNIKPTLLQEMSAWNKGEHHYDQGFRSSADVKKQKERDEYVENKVSVRGRKYPAFGTYLGSAVGATVGASLPFAAAIALKNREFNRLIPPLAFLGAGAGGMAGALGGGWLGRTIAEGGQEEYRQKVRADIDRHAGNM